MAQVLVVNDGDLGCTNLISHDIPLLGDIPVRQKYCCIPPSENDVVKTQINQLLESQVIRENSSPYASPTVLVRKKNSGLRLWVDYQLLNSKTRKDAFPLPHTEESLDALSGARWFSTIDLAHTIRCQWLSRTVPRPPLHPFLVFLNSTGCPLASPTPQAPSSG